MILDHLQIWNPKVLYGKQQYIFTFFFINYLWFYRYDFFFQITIDLSVDVHNQLIKYLIVNDTYLIFPQLASETFYLFKRCRHRKWFRLQCRLMQQPKVEFNIDPKKTQ